MRGKQRRRIEQMIADEWKKVGSIDKMLTDNQMSLSLKGTISRIARHDTSVSVEMLLSVARQMELIPPPQSWYRPCLSKAGKGIASNTELDELLAAMRENDLDTDDILMLIRDETIRQEQRY